jgi:hypothetical protein
MQSTRLPGCSLAQPGLKVPSRVVLWQVDEYGREHRNFITPIRLPIKQSDALGNHDHLC